MSDQLEFWEAPEPPGPTGTDKVIDWDRVRGVDLVNDPLLNHRWIKEVHEPFARRLMAKRALRRRRSIPKDPGPGPVDG
ncbi:MAG: hypothetical protein WC661_17455 [Opitutaceae bacterium]